MRRLTSCAIVISGLTCVALPLGGLGLRTACAEEAGDSGSLLEEPRARQGYWLGMGLSRAEAQLNEEGRNRGFYDGQTFTFRLGELVTRRLGIGLLFEYGTLKKGSDQGHIVGLTMEGSCVLWRNLSVHSGFGVGAVYVSDKEAIDTSLRGGAGSYLLLGTSYDAFPWRNRLTGGWSITPSVDLRVMPHGNIHALAILAGVQIMWWSGLANRMLRLPEE
jgi:hypothetical protein